MRLSIVLLALCLVSCKKLPKIEWCLLNGDGTGECAIPGEKDPVTKDPEQLENYVCASSSDLEKLINACKANSN